MTAPNTRGRAVEDGWRALRAAQIPDPQREAALLLAHCTHARALDLLVAPDESLDEPTRERYAMLVRRRASRVPLQHLIGSVGFHEVELGVGPDVLVPRPETEVLVDAVLERLRRQPIAAPRILDLGTGSGAIAIAIAAALPSARVIATDSSPPALAVANRNRRSAGVASRVALVRGDWLGPFGEDLLFDTIVSNPPYVRTGDIATLEPEVRDHDPRMALDGGPDGLACHRVILSRAVRHLSSDGFVVLEIGADQIDAARELARQNGFGSVEVRTDLAGRDRVLIADR